MAMKPRSASPLPPNAEAWASNEALPPTASHLPEKPEKAVSVFTLRLSNELLAAIDAEAKASALTRSGWIKYQLQKALKEGK